jgi:hypothetical protein
MIAARAAIEKQNMVVRRLFEEIADLLKRTYCAIVRGGFKLWRGVTDGIFGSNSPEGLSVMRRWASYRFCNEEPPPTPDSDDFNQCACVLYNFSITGRVTDANGNPQSQTFVRNNIAGPISFYFEKTSSFVTSGIQMNRLNLTYRSAIASACPLITFDETDLWATVNRASEAPGYTINYLIPVGATPPGCGEGEPDEPPWQPGDYKYDFDINYSNDDVFYYTIPITIEFKPAFIDNNFNIKIPVDINLKANLNFNPTFNLNFKADLNFNTGDVEFNFPTPPGTDPPRTPPPPKFEPPPTTPDPVPPPPPPDVPDPEPPPEGEPALKRVIVGAIVTVTDPEEAAKIGVLGQAENPDVYFPDLGLVSFQIRSKGGAGWTEDIRVKNVRQFIACPWGGGAVSVKGTARTGATMTVTPVYGYPEERLTTV